MWLFCSSLSAEKRFIRPAAASFFDPWSSYGKRNEQDGTDSTLG